MTIPAARNVRFASICAVKTFETEEPTSSLKTAEESRRLTFDANPNPSKTYLLRKTAGTLRHTNKRLNDLLSDLMHSNYDWKRRRITRSQSPRLLRMFSLFQERTIKHSLQLQQFLHSPTSSHFVESLNRMTVTCHSSVYQLKGLKKILLPPSEETIPLSLR